ncbi:MAG: RNA methyltransferase [Clostridiales bacterium]|nr:RNA methyltransferase [Clostridiales bacterium]
MPERLTSRANEKVRRMRRLGSDAAFRRETGEFLCEGLHLLGEAVREKFTVTEVFWDGRDENVEDTAKALGVRVTCVSPEIIGFCSTTLAPQGVLFSAKLPTRSGIPAGKRFLILDSVADPGNVGTALRSADAFSVDAVLLTGACADPFSPKVVRASMGAIFRTPVYRFDRADAKDVFAALGVPVFAAVLGGEDLRERSLSSSAVVIGNEAAGVSPEIRRLCSAGLAIPMSGRAESLNAGVAASIFAWEMSR